MAQGENRLDLINNGWRQGQLFYLTNDIAEKLELSNEHNACLIISQNCDIACQNHEIEPNIDILLLTTIESINTQKTSLKSFRHLHFSHEHDGNKIHFECLHLHKVSIKKESAISLGEIETQNLDRNVFTQILSWITLRYKRASFPEAFELRMEKLESSFKKKFKNKAEALSAILIQLDVEDELTDGQVYQIRIIGVVDDMKEYESTVLANAKEIAIEFIKKANELEGIKVTNAEFEEVLEHSTVTLGMLQNFKVYPHFKYSFRDEEPDSHIEVTM